jgi:hypothetical protein
MPPKTPVRNVLGDVTNDARPVPIAKTGTVFKAGLADNDHPRLVLLSKFEAGIRSDPSRQTCQAIAVQPMAKA